MYPAEVPRVLRMLLGRMRSISVISALFAIMLHRMGIGPNQSEKREVERDDILLVLLVVIKRTKEDKIAMNRIIYL